MGCVVCVWCMCVYGSVCVGEGERGEGSVGQCGVCVYVGKFLSMTMCVCEWLRIALTQRGRYHPHSHVHTQTTYFQEYLCGFGCVYVYLCACCEVVVLVTVCVCVCV